MQILGTLDIRKYDDTHWMLLSDPICIADEFTTRVQNGFIFDGGSVPKSLWSIVPPLSTAADWGFLFHDACYAYHRDQSEYVTVSDEIDRKQADQLMMEIHLHCGVSQELAEAVYGGVRLGASRSWMSPQEQLDSGIILELPDYYEQ